MRLQAFCIPFLPDPQVKHSSCTRARWNVWVGKFQSMAFLISLAFTSPHAAPTLPTSHQEEHLARCQNWRTGNDFSPPAEHATPRSVISWVQRRLSLHSGQLHGSPSGFHSEVSNNFLPFALALCLLSLHDASYSGDHQSRANFICGYASK